MNPTKTLLLSAALLLACAPAGVAQRRRRPIPPPVNPPRLAWTILVNQSNNEDGVPTTTVALEPLQLNGFAGVRTVANLAANFSYEGRPGTPPRFVALLLYTRSQTCQLRSDTGLRLQLDGRPLFLPFRPVTGQEEGVWWVARDEEAPAGRTCLESLGAFVTPQTLARLARASTVTLHIGLPAVGASGPSFGLPPLVLDALRDFTRRVPPAGK
ncbi:MAG TPA: hypothetical protein VF546_07685 [Pyrinomonadaceae bacterium]|jgi:hypothetical protein